MCLISAPSKLLAQDNTKQKTEEKQVFLVVEDMPQFNNGDIKTFQKWVMENVKYPEAALKKGISGKVFCEFVVEIDGSVEDVKIIKSVDKLLDDEVIRVIKSSTNWTPGKQRGKNVPVKMSLPVVFKLDSDKQK